jgi:hypothetical protein
LVVVFLLQATMMLARKQYNFDRDEPDDTSLIGLVVTVLVIAVGDC